MRRVLPLTLCLLALATEARAQAVVGRVVERGGRGPVPGAMVRLTSGGLPVGRGWLTGPDGRFSLEAPPGVYTLRVERIGFATTLMHDIRLEPEGIASVAVVVDAEPVRLEGLRVETEGRRCGMEAGSDATQLLWDEARKALAAATWTEREGSLRFELTAWDRQVDPRTSRVMAEETQRRSTVGGNSVQSLPAEELEARGYVEEREGFDYYYAPDAEALLSQAFQRAHCFRVVTDDDRPGRVGLAFEPAPDRRLPDVEGVLWVDEATRRLDEVEFGYTELDRPGASRAGGRVVFAELADGRWIVREWVIRAPMGVEALAPRMRRGPLQPGFIIHEVGNRVLVAEGPDVLWRPDLPPGAIAGTVFDSIAGEPLEGASVRLAGRPAGAATDARGRFSLSGVPAGSYRISFTHPRLEGLGVQAAWRPVSVDPGVTTQVALAVPEWVTVVAARCQGGPGGAVVGRVLDDQGEPVRGANVVVPGGPDRGGGPPSAVTDQRGVYGLCGLLAPGDVRLVVRYRGATSEAIPVQTRADAYVRRNITLTLAGLPEGPRRPEVAEETADAPGGVPGALRPALVGTVFTQGTREPLEGVEVALVREGGGVVARAYSEADGTFRTVLDEGGVLQVRLRRLGYTGAVSEPLDLSEGTRRVEIFLPEEAVELEPLVVVVEGRVPRLEREGFYSRAVTHPGIFIRRDDIDAISPPRTSDLLGRVPGVRVSSSPLSGDLRRRVVFNRLALTGGERCYPTVFVDGDLVRMGGSRAETDAPPIEGIQPDVSEDVEPIDELVPPREIEAMELYDAPGQVPQRFVGLGTRCGVIVIWTRRDGG